MIILGIETSCDETAISVVESKGNLENLQFKILGSALHSQVKVHEQYGGVFPTLAKREHIKNLPIVYKQAIVNAKIKEEEIEAITVTVGPGLEPALWTGITFAKELGDKLKVKVIPANHMLGHIASVLFDTEKITFPALALLISGGHTELVLLKNWAEKKIIGETQDDAVGEAFDKVARMLSLPYPGGPQISKLAEEAREKEIFVEKKLPRPMLHSGDLNFSFSGLKTAVLYYLRDNPKADKFAVAREFEDSVIEVLVSKTISAIEKYSPKNLIIGGGVIANKALRENFSDLEKRFPEIKVLIPDKSLTTDNATMIVAAGYIESLTKSNVNKLTADGGLKIG